MPLACPACGSPMRLRVSARGPFYGCSTFPRCRRTLPADNPDPAANPAPANGGPAIVEATSAEAAWDALDGALRRLDPEQAAVVAALRAPGGNLRVVAAAGSGKTTTVVVGIGAVVADGLQPGAVIATTFTKKAGGELVARLARVLPPGALRAMRVGTFHSIALKSVTALAPARFDFARNLDGAAASRAEGVPSTGMLWSKVCGYDNVPGLGENGLNLNLADNGLSASDYSNAADLIRSRCHDPGTPGAAEEARNVYLPSFERAWMMFERAKHALAAWDFADALSAYYQGLLAGTIVDGAAMVVVDEAQDNSKIQLEIARLLARNGRLVLVGDCRQAIYSWRGAWPRMFAEADTLLGAATLELPNNYRSGRRIVAIGNEIATGKDWSIGIPARATRALDGDARIFGGHEDPGAEARAVAEVIAAGVQEGGRPEEYAILTRTNAYAGIFEAALVKARIPCAVAGGVPFFGRAEVQDFLAYAVLSQHDAFNSLARIANKPKRYLGRAFTDAVQARMAAGAALLDAIEQVAPTLRGGSVRGAERLLADLRELRAARWPRSATMAAALLCRQPEQESTALSTLADRIEESGSGTGEDGEGKGALYVAAAAVAQSFESPKALIEFAAQCASTLQVAEGERAPGRVTVSTIHKAKGLEWTHLFISASAGNFPHVRAEDIEEEHRLFYVAVTRARDDVTFTWAEENLFGREAGPSRFLDFAEPHLTPEPDPTDAPQAPPPAPQAPPPAPEEPRLPRGDVLAFPAASSAGATALRVLPPPVDDEARRAFLAAVEGRALPDPAVLLAARAFAEVRTEAEPPTIEEGGEGARSVGVRPESFDEMLAPLGFARLAARDQESWVLARPGSTEVVVYSSIPIGAELARGVGEDSIRIVALWGDRAILPREAWVCRTRGWRLSLLDRVESVVQAMGDVAPCPACSAPTVARERRDGSGAFLGCVRYPECKGVAE